MLLLTHCRGIQSFTIGRNITIFVDDVDSQETATDDPLDSMEHAQNQTSVEDDVHNDSLENKDLLIKSNFQFVEGLNQTQVQISAGDANDDFSLEDHSVGSNDQIQTHDVDHDDIHDTHSMEDIITIDQQQANQTAEHLFNQFKLHLLEVQDDLVKRNAPIADANVQSATEGQHLIKHFDIQDDSLEDQLARLIVPVAADDQLQTSTPDVVLTSPVSIFDNQPIVGIFSHPASDDLYLVKEYLGDYYFWEIEHELVRDSLLQPVRDVIKLDSDSPIKVDAVQFAQFTPVRSLWDDRQQATSTAV